MEKSIDWWVALSDDGVISYSAGLAQLVDEWIEDATAGGDPELKYKRVKGRLTIKGYDVKAPHEPMEG